MQAIIQLVPGQVLTQPPPSLVSAQLGKFFINIYDDNGNPTNGNNITVSYRKSVNGVPGPIQTVAISGLSIKLFDGVIKNTDFNGNVTNIVNFTLTGQTSPGLPAPPLSPDLKINSIQIIEKADSSGNNGKVTIYASSSFLPIDYYIDDVLQSGYQNLTVTAGTHTAKVIDVTLTEIEQDFTVPQLNSILADDPAISEAGKISRWSAAFNPVVFTYQRKDFDVTGISQDGTTLKPKIVLNTNLTGLNIGDYIYLDAGITNTLSTFQGAFKVLRIDGIDTIVIDTDYVAPDTVSGYANSDTLRPYYKVITNIKYVDPVTGRFNTIVSTNRPGPDGTTRADISSFLQSILKPQPDLSNYTAINYRDMGLSASYQVSYAETWADNQPVFSEIASPFYVVYAAAQLQEAYGGNLFDFVTQQGGSQLAKWLSDFNEPSYTVGFPFDLGFIYSEQIAGKQIYSVITGLDINRQSLGIDQLTTFLLNEDGSFLLQQDGYKFIIARRELVNTPIVEHVGLNRLLINQDLGPQCWYLQVQLFYDEGETAIPVTEPKIVKVDKTCSGGYPVYLRWIGLTGSWNYYRFNYNQTKTLDVQNPVIIKDYIFDWENAEGIDRKISNNAAEKLQLFADALSKSDIDGLQSVKYSPIVQVLTNNNPLKWQTVVVNSSTFTEYDTQNGEYEFSITLNMPSKNIQTQ